MTAKKPRINRKDWRNLPLEQWNTLTFTVYFTDMNAELYGVKYLPMRNWRFEQAQIKRALDAHGPELLKAAFDECFRTAKPTPEYPILTAGFCVSYRINSILPRLIAEKQRKERREEAESEQVLSAEELAEWL